MRSTAALPSRGPSALQRCPGPSFRPAPWRCARPRASRGSRRHPQPASSGLPSQVAWRSGRRAAARGGRGRPFSRCAAGPGVPWRGPPCAARTPPVCCHREPHPRRGAGASPSRAGTASASSSRRCRCPGALRLHRPQGVWPRASTCPWNPWVPGRARPPCGAPHRAPQRPCCTSKPVVVGGCGCCSEAESCMLGTCGSSGAPGAGSSSGLHHQETSRRRRCAPTGMGVSCWWG
mmetsp:Transcript_63566/g.176249  ORF Transcript_63566/g.176249 Transcript_63566/m.176249 type:complete len:234 (-) Transcript_63566:315-1016(-)